MKIKKIISTISALAMAMILSVSVSAEKQTEKIDIATENTGETITVNTTTVSLESTPITIELPGSWGVWTKEYHDTELEQQWGETEQSWNEWAEGYSIVAEMVKNDNSQSVLIRYIPEVGDSFGESWAESTEDDLTKLASVIIYSMSETERAQVVGVNKLETEYTNFVVIDMLDTNSGMMSRFAYTVVDGNMYSISFQKVYDGATIQTEWDTSLNSVEFKYTPRIENENESPIDGSLFEKVGVVLLLMAILLFCLIVYGKIKSKK